MLGTRFATRLNSFASGAANYWPDQSEKPSLHQMVKRASSVAGLTDVDLNYPDHAGGDLRQTATMIADCGLAVNGLAMRYYTNPAFKLGAFTNPDASVRREAIDLTKRGIDATRALGSALMTLCWGKMALIMAINVTTTRCGRWRLQVSPKSPHMTRIA